MTRLFLAGILGVLAGAGSTIFVTVAHDALFGVESNLVPPVTFSPAATSSPPTRLLVPAIGVDAHVQAVGLTAAGAVGVPTNFVDVGWFAQSPSPGSAGSSIIDGHVNNGLALPGVFARLHEVNVGDEVEVINEDGERKTFVVWEVKKYPYKDAPVAEIFGGTEPRLVLITCGGRWLPGERTYDERVVVYAHPKKLGKR